MLDDRTGSDYDGAVQPDEEWAEFVDTNVVDVLPEGTEVLRIVPHGASVWSQTARIDTEQKDGTAKSYFIRLTKGPIGDAMVKGELESMTMLNRHIPRSTPTPIAAGTYAADPNIHFFLSEFVPMIDETPDIQRFTAQVAELHRISVSPNGKYGFSVPTYLGNMAQYTTWTDSWETFFTNYLKHLMSRIEKAQTLDDEFIRLFEAILEKVVPRLLRPLETGGRTIKPSLVHGDLYAGNVSVDEEALEPIIYDAACLYAHNEYEIGHWDLLRHKIGRPYIKSYFRQFPIADPEEDMQDRIMLYTLRWELKGLAIYPKDLRYKAYAMQDMRTLVPKFPNGYEGWLEENSSK